MGRGVALTVDGYSWFPQGVPAFLGGVFLVFWVFRDVPMFRCSVFRCSWKYYMLGLDTNISKNVLNFFLEILINFLNFF